MVVANIIMIIEIISILLFLFIFGLLLIILLLEVNCMCSEHMTNLLKFLGLSWPYTCRSGLSSWWKGVWDCSLRETHTHTHTGSILNRFSIFQTTTLTTWINDFMGKSFIDFYELKVKHFVSMADSKISWARSRLAAGCNVQNFLHQLIFVHPLWQVGRDENIHVYTQAPSIRGQDGPAWLWLVL